MYCCVFQKVNIYKRFSISNKHCFRSSPVSYNTGHWFENQSLRFLNFCFYMQVTTVVPRSLFSRQYHIFDKHSFGLSPVSFKRGYCFENQGQYFLNLRSLYAGHNLWHTDRDSGRWKWNFITRQSYMQDTKAQQIRPSMPTTLHIII